MMQDLIFVGDKVPSLFAVAGYGGAGHRQFCPEIQFDCDVDNRDELPHRKRRGIYPKTRLKATHENALIKGHSDS